MGLGAYGDVVVCHVVDVGRDFFASEDDQYVFLCFYLFYLVLNRETVHCEVEFFAFEFFDCFSEVFLVFYLKVAAPALFYVFYGVDDLFVFFAGQDDFFCAQSSCCEADVGCQALVAVVAVA